MADFDPGPQFAFKQLKKLSLVNAFVIGSRDPDHFHPGMRMDFLSRIGELIAVALESEYGRERK